MAIDFIKVKHFGEYGGTIKVGPGSNYARFIESNFDKCLILVDPEVETTIFIGCLFLDCKFDPPAEEMMKLGIMHSCVLQQSDALPNIPPTH